MFLGSDALPELILTFNSKLISYGGMHHLSDFFGDHCIHIVSESGLITGQLMLIVDLGSTDFISVFIWTWYHNLSLAS